MRNFINIKTNSTEKNVHTFCQGIARTGIHGENCLEFVVASEESNREHIACTSMVFIQLNVVTNGAKASSCGHTIADDLV